MAKKKTRQRKNAAKKNERSSALFLVPNRKHKSQNYLKPPNYKATVTTEPKNCGALLAQFFKTALIIPCWLQA